MPTLIFLRHDLSGLDELMFQRDDVDNGEDEEEDEEDVGTSSSKTLKNAKTIVSVSKQCWSV